MVVAAYSVAGILQGNVTTDSNGNYALTLPVGQYRFLAYDNSGTYATMFAADADSFDTCPVTNVIGDLNGPNFSLRRAGTISGKVLAAATGAPLAGMTVAAYNTATGTRRTFTQTDAAGGYTLVVPPGTYRLAAYDNNGAYAPRFFDDQPTFVSAADLTIASNQARIDTTFRLAAAAHLSGKVIDADTNQPLGAKQVIAYTPDGIQVAATTSDIAGNFNFALGAGAYKIVAADAARFYATGYIVDANSFTNEPGITLQSGQTIDTVRVPLHRAGAISGEVRDATGAPLGGMTAAAYNEDGTQRASAQTDANGAYSLLLPPGSFRIGAFDNSLTFATSFFPNRIAFTDARPVTVVAGLSETTIDLTLARGAKISGTVIDQQSGQPAPGITVAAYDDNGNAISTAISNAAGAYALVVPAGNYRFAAFDGQLRYVTAYNGGARSFDTANAMSVVAASTNQLNFALKQGVRLSGTVIDSSAAFLSISGVQIGALDLAGNRVATATTSFGNFDLVVAPGTYKLLATDPLGRYYAIFYNGAWTLAAATPVTVTANGASPITLQLIRLTRHRAAPH